MLLVAVAGCGGGDGGGPVTPQEPPRPTTIAISPESAALSYLGQTTPFNATVRDQYGAAIATTVTWSSSDEAVFTVDASGTATAVGNGSGTVQATAGALNATASVMVQQRAAVMTIVSGNDQEGLRLTTLPEPVVVRAADRGGFGVAGVAVSFSPGAESGSVSVESAESDENGEATTEWTLGGKFGAQTLTVSAPGGVQNRVSARATSDTPLPDLSVERLDPSRIEPTDLETIVVEVGIANKGDAASPDTFQVRLTLDGVPLETVQVAQLQPEDTTSVTFMAAGPFEAGRRTLAVEVDPEGEIEEWQEANNTATESLNVAHQEVLTPGQSTTVSSSTVDEVLLFRVDIDLPSDEALNVVLSGGTGDADMFVNYDERPDHHYKYRCLSGNAASDELCQMVPTRRGSYHVAVHAFTAFGPSTLTINVGETPVEPFDIEVVFLDGGTASQDQVVRDAAERWESVIGRGADDFTYQEDVLAGTCGPGSPAITAGETVDDVRIYVTIDSIDGTGGILGQATPCSVRRIGFTGSDPIDQEVIRGYMQLDEDDVNRLEAQGGLVSTITHEMGHVLGFGSTLWDDRGLKANPSVGSGNSPDADTHFTGPLALAAFDAAGGRGYRGGAKVPLQNGGEQGSSDSHWRETVFENELMTPYLQAGVPEPLSRITIEAMADLGYEVNPSAAESYRITGAGAVGAAKAVGPVIDLSNDIARIPIRVFDQRGRLVRIINPLP